MKKFLCMITLLLGLTFATSCVVTYYSLDIVFDSEQGSVTYTKETNEKGYKEGTSITLNVQPNEGYVIANVDVNGKGVELENGKYVFAIYQDTKVNVQFEKQGESTHFYAISVKANDAQVTYELSYPEDAKQEDGKYLEGTQVTFIASAKDNFEIVSVSINNEVQDFTNGTCQFVLTKYTQIEVITKEVDKTIPLAALQSVQTALKCTGQYTLVYEKDETLVQHTLVTIFDSESVSQVERDLATGEVLYNLGFINYEGNCGQPYISMTNKVYIVDLGEPFDEYDNPFKDLTVSDFEMIEPGKYELKYLRKPVASCITGWEESIEKFYVYVSDDKIVKLEFVTEPIEVEDSEGNIIDTYVSTYTFDITEHGTAKSGVEVKPFEKSPEHSQLEEALSKITNNYTLVHLDEWAGEEDVVYNVYVDDKSIYSDYATDGITYGYLELNGFVYRFAYDGKVVTVGDALSNFKTIGDVQAKFNTFDPAVMEYVGDGTFVARTPEIASEIASWIGEDYDAQRLGAYVTYLQMTIKDGELYQIVYEYVVYGYKGTVTLTYSNINSTIVPVNFENMVQTSVLDPYMGTWNSDDQHQIVVTKEGIFVDGVEFVVTSYSSQEGFVGTLDGVTYSLMMWSNANELAQFNAEGYVVRIYTLDEETKDVVIPDAYKGIWKGEGHKIEVHSKVVFVDDIEFTITGYTEQTGLVGKYNGETYYLVLVDDEISTELYFARNDFSTSFATTLTPEAYFEIEDGYVGTWVNEANNITVVITYAGIVINDVRYVITNKDATGYEGKLGEVSEYYVSFYYSDDKLQIGTMRENYIVTKKADNPNPNPSEIVIPEESIGTYKGTKNDVEYIVIITKDAITINGTAFVPSEYDEYEGWTGTYNGETYYVTYMAPWGDSPAQVMVMNSDYSLVITCDVVEEPTPTVTIPEESIGTYKGTKNDVEYIVVITKDAITINGTAFVPSEYDEYEGWTGTYNGETYYVTYMAPWGDLPAQVMVMNSDFTLNVTCDVVKEETPTEIQIPAAWVGTYQKESNGQTYVLVITENQITLNGIEYVITAYDAYEGFTGTYNGEEYFLSNASYDDSVFVPAFMNSDYSFYILFS
ncbi:MAG: hypothetical protein NC090_00255 [Anaeroplasma bactoclasticum]|nr:hypothetical protein [Anaeroplasma bactoclasticum]